MADSTGGAPGEAGIDYVSARNVRRIEGDPDTRAPVGDSEERFDGTGGDDPSNGSIVNVLEDFNDSRESAGDGVGAASRDAT